MDYLQSTMHTLVFDILISWKWHGTNHKKCCQFNATLTGRVMDENCNFLCPKLIIVERRVNSLAPGRCVSSFKSLSFKFIIQDINLGIPC